MSDVQKLDAGMVEEIVKNASGVHSSVKLEARGPVAAPTFFVEDGENKNSVTGPDKNGNSILLISSIYAESKRRKKAKEDQFFGRPSLEKYSLDTELPAAAVFNNDPKTFSSFKRLLSFDAPHGISDPLIIEAVDEEGKIFTEGKYGQDIINSMTNREYSAFVRTDLSTLLHGTDVRSGYGASSLCFNISKMEESEISATIRSPEECIVYERTTSTPPFKISNKLRFDLVDNFDSGGCGWECNDKGKIKPSQINYGQIPVSQKNSPVRYILNDNEAVASYYISANKARSLYFFDYDETAVRCLLVCLGLLGWAYANEKLGFSLRTGCHLDMKENPVYGYAVRAERIKFSTDADSLLELYRSFSKKLDMPNKIISLKPSAGQTEMYIKNLLQERNNMFPEEKNGAV
jgi:hypothetical protein